MVRWVRGRLPGRYGRGGHTTRLHHGPPLLRDTEADVVIGDSTQPPNVGVAEPSFDEANIASRIVSTNARTDAPSRKRGRGPAKDTLFDRVRKFGQIPLNIKDGQRGPSCENYNLFSGRVTTIVRLHANMMHASWKAVPKEEKEELIDRVKADFKLDWTQSSHRECVTNAVARKYNGFHYLLRKQYIRYGSKEAALSGGTSWVEKPVWEHLCRMWSTEEFEKMSKRNQKNRQKQNVNHTGGRKPFVRILEEMNEEDPNLIQFYREVHWSRKKGCFITGQAEQNYKLMLERLDETEVNTENNNEKCNAAFKEVLGYKAGYATGLGHSVIPEASIALRKNRDYVRIVEENERNKNEAHMYKSQLEVLRDELHSFKNQFKDYQSTMNNRVADLECNQRESHQETNMDA
ncbi:hypothetical protein I3843_03G242000 [Carya illinoinensis]|nr:hypothetical protein I3843_15G149500 [Carya illinoinensis]KAG7966832.1 hypothetical protein I3843_08G068300 [Carya illinoinensis]KAG7989502.1 hypothetical protein I3843_03G242000 [Carya illinoinensis]